MQGERPHSRPECRRGMGSSSTFEFLQTKEVGVGAHRGLAISDGNGKAKVNDLRKMNKDLPKTVIVNIQNIENHEVFKLAFQDWNRQVTEERSKVDDGEKEKSDIVKQIYSIIWVFCVFQGVALTAVSQLSSSQSRCGKIWSPILLSVVAAPVTIVILWDQFRIMEFRVHNLNLRQSRWKGLMRRLQALRMKGLEFDFETDASDLELSTEPEPNFWFKKMALFVSILLFTGLFVWSYFVILRDKWEIGG